MAEAWIIMQFESSRENTWCSMDNAASQCTTKVKECVWSAITADFVHRLCDDERTRNSATTTGWILEGNTGLLQRLRRSEQAKVLIHHFGLGPESKHLELEYAQSLH